MQVQVRYYGGLYEYVPQHLKDISCIEIAPGSTVEDLIQALAIPEHAIWLVTIANQQVPAKTLLNDGDCIEIFAPATGG